MTVYGLVERSSGMLRYIGQTRHTVKLRNAQRRCITANPAPSVVWYHKETAEGREPITVIIERDAPLGREAMWIAHYRQAGIQLLNITSNR